MTCRVRKVRDAIGGAERPAFNSGLLKARIYPESGELHMHRENMNDASDPLRQRPWEMKIPIEEAEVLCKWLMEQYGDFDGPEVKPRKFL